MSEPMAKRVVREVVRSVVQRTSTDGTTPSALKSAADPADKVNARSRRAPSYLARRGYTYYFQIRPPLALAPCKLSRPLRVRLGCLPQRDAQRIAAMLAGLAQEMFEARRRVMDAYGGPGDLPEEERNGVGFPRGNSPEEFRANMLTFFKEALAKISKPVVDRATPSELRFRAAFHECMLLTQELKKGDHANQLIVSRVDMLQQDIWDRWVAGEGRPPVRLPNLTAEELKHLMGGSELAAIHAKPTEQTPPAVDRSAPPAATPAVSNPHIEQTEVQARSARSRLPLFSQVAADYCSMLEGAGARHNLSTTRMRARIFHELMGDRAVDQYVPKDIQDYVSLLQYLPLEYSKPSKNAEILQKMSAAEVIEKNKRARIWEPLSLKTMQDGYVQVVKSVFTYAVQNHRIHHPLSNLRIRWPSEAKPSVAREALDFETLNRTFDLGVKSGFIDDAILPLLAYLTSRRIGIMCFLRGSDIREKHGVWIARVNGIVFDNDRNMFVRVPYKSEESLRFFVLHQIFSDIGFVDWAKQQEDSFIFPHLQACTDPADAASKRINRLLKKAGAEGTNIEVAHSMRHGAKDLMIDEDIDSETARLQMGHELGDAHFDYGRRAELRRKQCRELAHLPLPPEIDWSVFRWLDFKAMASKERKGGRPKKCAS